MTILATKIIKIGQLGPEIWLFSSYGITAKFLPGFFQGKPMFYPQYPLMNVSGHHNIKQHIWIDHNSHKNHQGWSTGAENMTFFPYGVTSKFSPRVFSWLFHVFTKYQVLDVSSHHNIKKHTWIDQVCYKNYQGWSIGAWNMAVLTGENFVVTPYGKNAKFWAPVDQS